MDIWEPADRVEVLDAARLDRVAVAFASIVDAKSPYTAAHSAGRGEIAVGVGQVLGIDERRLRDLYRAGLLHDIGKLGVSSRMLDKPGALDRRGVGRDQRATRWRRCRSCAGSARCARWPACRRCTTSGWTARATTWGSAPTQLDLPARVLAVADVAEALRRGSALPRGAEPRTR